MSNWYKLIQSYFYSSIYNFHGMSFMSGSGKEKRILTKGNYKFLYVQIIKPLTH